MSLSEIDELNNWTQVPFEGNMQTDFKYENVNNQDTFTRQVNVIARDSNNQVVDDQCLDLEWTLANNEENEYLIHSDVLSQISIVTEAGTSHVPPTRLTSPAI